MQPRVILNHKTEKFRLVDRNGKTAGRVDEVEARTGHGLTPGFNGYNYDPKTKERKLVAAV